MKPSRYGTMVHVTRILKYNRKMGSIAAYISQDNPAKGVTKLGLTGHMKGEEKMEFEPTPKQIIAVQSIASGKTKKEAAIAADVTPQTITSDLKKNLSTPGGKDLSMLGTQNLEGNYRINIKGL